MESQDTKTAILRLAQNFASAGPFNTPKKETLTFGGTASKTFSKKSIHSLLIEIVSGSCTIKLGDDETFTETESLELGFQTENAVPIIITVVSGVTNLFYTKA